MSTRFACESPHQLQFKLGCKMSKVLFLSQCLLLAIVLRHSGDVSGQLTAAPPTCPGGTITFTCNVAGVNGITIWRVGGSRNLCILSHISTSPATCGENNDFRATPGTGFGTNVTTLYSSTLSGNATYALDGALVECFGPVNSVDTGNRVNGSTLWTLGPPSALTLSYVDLSEDVSGAVNVTVSWTLSGGDSADFYLISITTNAPQTPYGGLLNITTGSVTQHELTGFMAGYEYNITVRGVNCGSQEGNESEPLTIRPQVPAVPRSGNIILLYNQSSGRLLSINSNWDSVPDPVDPCAGVSGKITQYQISFQTGSVVVTDIARCTAGRCSHTFEPPSNPPSSYDSVSVAAENVVGVGAARNCTTQPINTTNNLLTGEMADVSSPGGITFNCTFLSGFTGSAHCTVQYGTDPTYMNLPYFAESTETGTAGDTVSVVLRERLNSTVYYYTVSAVSGDVTVTVQGNFMTPQYMSSSNAATIVGGAIGGVVAVAVVAALAIGGVLVLKRSKKKSDKDLRSEKTKNSSHNGREEFSIMVLAPLPEVEPPGSQYAAVEAVHRNPNPPPVLDDRVQYSDVLPQKTHITSVSNEESPPLPNKPYHVRPLTVETLFTKLHPIVTPKWMKLGELLGMDEDLLDEIYANNEKDEECLRALLEMWLQKSTNPTWKNVTNAVTKIDKRLEVATQEENKSELSKSGGSASRKVIEPVDCQCRGLPEVSSYFVAPAEEFSCDDDEVQVTQEISEGLVLFQCTAETTKGKDIMVSGTVMHGTAHQANQSACEHSQSLPDSTILKSVVS